MTRPLGDCPECGCDWGRHSMPGDVKMRVLAGAPVEPINTCPFCNCQNTALPPLLVESYEKFG